MLTVVKPNLPPEYVSWQQRLAHEFFDGREGQPVVMFVDLDDLQRLAGSGEDPVRSLASAVKRLVTIDAGASMFRAVLLEEAAWRRGVQDEPPPTLPVLALSVLAASEMRRDASAASHNYYIRLARALVPDGSDAEIETLRRCLRERGAFTDVVGMWQRIHRWIGEQGGACGTSTIPENPRRSRIGYPLSQALVRRSDRAALTKFFDRMHLTRAGIPGPEALLRLLRLWTSRRPQGYSDRFLQALEEPDLRDLMMPLVHDLATNWDGKVITADGLRRLEIRLAIDIDRGAAWWAIPQGRDKPADILTGISAGEPFTALLTPDPHAAVYQVEGLPPVSPATLGDGLLARGSSCVAEFRPSDLWVFVDSADAGGWLAVEAVQAYEEHVIAVRPEDAPDVEAALSLAADGGWKRLKDSFAQQLLSGYTIYYGITFSDRERLTEAIELLPWKVAKNVQLGTTLRPRLINGLPLLPSIGRNIYLAGGEPDLELPLGAGQRHVPVVLDGSSPQPLLASIFPIPFSVVLHGELGVHNIEADGEMLRFEVIADAGSDLTPPGVGVLGWTGDQLEETTTAGVCGALTLVDHTTPSALIRRGALEYWLADHAGHLTQLNEPETPTFLPDASFAYFDIAKSRGCWVLQRRNRGWEVTRLSPREPRFQTLSADERHVWHEASVAIQTSDRLWPLYVAASERARGH